MSVQEAATCSTIIQLEGKVVSEAAGGPRTSLIPRASVSLWVAALGIWLSEDTAW